ncbi:putative amidohydrolase [Amycolatopsis sulphurea]|uniref:Putative amidohydrolase n=1 Tax=Amycolatopsis sulphurea TaxID=76022 RepID=A0A2A9G1H5_9PSEU|nr:carbon-nitrogen hydrolase family protein [Amycolatopsis sulphurea]PFG57013.1 putative amidohydrolase [Amycolatopsis sulphurea]
MQRDVNRTHGTARIAVAQLPPAGPAPDADLAAVIEAIGQAGNADLVVFPECALSGYLYDSRAAVAQAAIRLGDPRIDRLVQACRAASVHAVVGFLESDGDDLYNCAATLGPEGVLGTYRKQHLPYMGADRFVSPGRGDTPRVVETPFGKVGVMICFDLRFPESARVLALEGADVIAMPTAWPLKATFLAEHVTRVRALENLVYLAVSDRTGHENGAEYLGHSQIVAPSGEVLVDAGADAGVFGTDVALSQARTKDLVFVPGEYELRIFSQRKPSQYTAITEEDPSRVRT